MAKKSLACCTWRTCRKFTIWGVRSNHSQGATAWTSRVLAKPLEGLSEATSHCVSLAATCPRTQARHKRPHCGSARCRTWCLTNPTGSRSRPWRSLAGCRRSTTGPTRIKKRDSPSCSVLPAPSSDKAEHCASWEKKC